MNIGLQLYTVRDMLKTEEEIKHTLAAVKEIGYQSVQLFGDLEMLEKCAKYSLEAGLSVVGILTNMTLCEASPDALFALCKTYNIADIGIGAWQNECEDIAGYIQKSNAFAEKAKKEGFTVSYHNHGYEFIKLADGKTPMAHLLDGLDADLVDFMPDVYWVHDGGYDVRYFLEQTKGRMKILHLKDMKRTNEGHTFTEVGNGNLYMEGIIKAAKESGVKHLIVEQDICEGDPLKSAEQSFHYIQSML